jgi:hypothetical protein
MLNTSVVIVLLLDPVDPILYFKNILKKIKKYFIFFFTLN